MHRVGWCVDHLSSGMSLIQQDIDVARLWQLDNETTYELSTGVRYLSMDDGSMTRCNLFLKLREALPNS